MKQPTSERTKRLVIWLIAVLPFLVILSATTYNAVVQPGCTWCHDRDAEFAANTDSAPHSQVECVACHVAPGTLARFNFGFRELVHMQIPLVSGNGRDWAAVGDVNCLACHKDIKAEVVTANGIRIDHESCAAEAECTDCHSTVAHGDSTSWVRTYDMETCLACHATKASTKCDVCHVEKDREARVSTGVFAITHGANWKTTHGMGNTATCSVCHTAAKCEKCHGVGLPHDTKFLEEHPSVASDPRAKCTSCHDADFCISCHGTPMPHTREFTRNHAAQAEDDPKLCKRCHADPDCTQCHEKHVHPGGAVGSLSGSTPAKGGQ